MIEAFVFINIWFWLFTWKSNTKKLLPNTKYITNKYTCPTVSALKLQIIIGSTLIYFLHFNSMFKMKEKDTFSSNDDL